MNIDMTQLPQDEEAAVGFLRRAARGVRGRPLKRDSWRIVVNALRSPRLGPVLVQRLRSAKDRDDLLRVLRIARKAGVRKHLGRGSRGSGKAKPHLVGAREVYLDGEIVWWRYWEDDEAVQARWDLQDLQAQHGYWPFGDLRLSGVQAISVIEELASRIRTPLRHQLSPYHSRSLRSVVGDAAFDRLVQAHGGKAAKAADKFPAPSRIEDYGTFSGLVVQWEDEFPPGISIDWSQVGRGVVERLLRSPEGCAESDLRAALLYVTYAPAEFANGLLESIGSWHPQWAPAFWRLVAIARGDDASGESESLEPRACVISRSPDVLGEVGFGSRLVQRLLLRGLVDRTASHGDMPIDRHGHLLQDASSLVLQAAGTFRRMDYPKFRVVSRGTFRGFSPDLVAEIRGIDADLRSLWQAISACGALAFEGLRSAQAGALQATSPAVDGAEPTVGLLDSIARHSIAHALLRAGRFAGRPEGIRARHVRLHWEEPEAESSSLLNCRDGDGFAGAHRRLAERFGPGPAAVSLAHALLGLVTGPWPDRSFDVSEVREAAAEALRDLSLAMNWPTGVMGAGEEPLRAILQVLGERVMQGPAALMASLRGLGADELPRLRGGQLTNRERRIRELLRRTSGWAAGSDSGQPPREFECRPLSKAAAILRGELAGDCSTRSVPMRALCPHYTYYGVWEKGEPCRGYMTVYEAWAEFDSGARLPVLCVETINVPIPCFDSIQSDLLALFDAIASSRGLHPRVVVSAALGTWNYPNYHVIRDLARFRRGQPVRLLPADPVQWRLYECVAPIESRAYSVFGPMHRSASGLVRHLAPRSAKFDPLQPENESEVARLQALRPRGLLATARVDGEPVGFISEMPEVP